MNGGSSGSEVGAQLVMTLSSIAMGTLAGFAWVYVVQPWLFPDLIC